ncbi:MAG: polysaccharide pyruvyl transferase family protein [Clostridia bacterium]|nr:polysaccharide pyruvyl transferase family protein [Clostridia bacterium]
MLQRLKKSAVVKIYRLFREDIYNVKNNIDSFFSAIFRCNKAMIYLQSPLHGNVGDLAIAEASLKWMKEKFNGIKVYEMVYGELTPLYRFMLKIMIRKGDVILLHGGGNLGTWYPSEENYRLYIIKNYKKNSIVVLPQSVFFSEDGDFADSMRKIYSAHPDLLVCARDEISLKIAKEKLDCKVELYPDMVLNFNVDLPVVERKNEVLFCLRNDRERRLDDGFFPVIKDCVKTQLSAECVVKDTHIGHRVSKKKRFNAVYNMLVDYSNVKLVITDRFHGGIFSYITGTPCVVLESRDHKVRGGYKWLRNSGNICLADPKSASGFALQLFDKANKSKNYINEFKNLEDYIKSKFY